jgi:hypothetical protein
MYPLLTLGLLIATWGLVGLVERPAPRLYPLLYLIGATIAIYSQIIALIDLSILNAVVLCCAWLNGAKPRVYLRWLGINVVLLVLSVPWLISIPDAIKNFGGFGPGGITTTQWFFRNIVGFPGLPPPFKWGADAVIIAIYLGGGIFAWKAGLRTLAAVSIGTLVIYPLVIALLSLITPIMENRVFIPCVIPASILFGVAIEALKRPVAQLAAATIVLAVASGSAVEARRLGTNPEDMPQALKLAEARGFAEAPVLTSNFLIAAEAHLYAPDRAVFFPGKGRDLIRFDNRTLAAYSLPAVERRQLDGPRMRRLMAENQLSINPERDWNSIQKVAIIGAAFWTDARMVEELRTLGFHKADAPVLTAPTRVVFDPLWTVLSLWSRPGASRANGDNR